jgi:hypothetical protein
MHMHMHMHMHALRSLLDRCTGKTDTMRLLGFLQPLTAW